MFTVFIDTSGYEAQGLSFEGPLFDSLKKLVKEKKIQIVTSEIIKQEIEAHLKESIAQSVNILEKASQKFDHRTKGKLGVISDLLADPDGLKENVLLLRTLTMDKFFKSVKASDLPTSTVKVETLIQDYFKQVAPFGDGKKKHEFPDAIMLNAFINENKENLSQTCLIADDPDWKRFSERYPDIIFFNKISELADYINSEYDSRIVEELKKAFEAHTNTFEKAFCRSIVNREGFDFDDAWVEPEEEIDEDSVRVKITEANLLGHYKDSAEWELTLKVSYTLNVTDVDADSWVRDSDTKEHFYTRKGEYSIAVNKTIEFVLDIYFKPQSIQSSIHLRDYILPDELFYIDGSDDDIEITEINDEPDWEP
ncbi:PIN domain-containing protein [Flavitalea sp. BT771]|uniref:PIN domain-containing protein n=1 Tax=Flavitalea sp. BT771 TaxID=3063329 RepID=UPI0026E24A9C|nr:PIN domain-containing protein [Flavitalea sp. BT771]MDO6430930.1 PIN domain-containing protein [Flavitalea sp. BT771]MDV6218930.1 PIN domain-containing protein [Flavitalea sp. BT771]